MEASKPRVQSLQLLRWVLANRLVRNNVPPFVSFVSLLFVYSRRGKVKIEEMLFILMFVSSYSFVYTSFLSEVLVSLFLIRSIAVTFFFSDVISDALFFFLYKSMHNSYSPCFVNLHFSFRKKIPFFLYPLPNSLFLLMSLDDLFSTHQCSFFLLWFRRSVYGSFFTFCCFLFPSLL